MYIVRIENKRGEMLRLTQHESAYQIIEIEGLNPPPARINLFDMASIDGAKFNNSKLETREIVITVRLNGAGEIVESNRQHLYRFFPTKEWCKFYYTNNYRDVYIEGYVNTVDVNPFTNGQEMIISIICPSTYFKGINEIIDDISKVVKMFEFPFAFGSNGATNPYVLTDPDTDDAIPFSEIVTDKVTNIYNNSESETGMIIEIFIIKTITSITIQNVDNGEWLTINDTFIPNDKITVNTEKGHKSVSLLRDGVESNIFTKVVKGSTFFQLNIGDNHFTFVLNAGAEDSCVSIVFRHSTVYRGV